MKKVSDLTGRVAQMQEKSKLQVDRKAPSESTLQTNVVQLPVWPDSVRGLPNGVLRSALFGVVRRGKRAFLQAEQMASVENLSVLFTGPRLDQGDLDVCEHCFHLARTGPLGTRVQFSAHSFLKAIGRDTGKSQHEWLENALRRLMSSVVEIKDGKKSYAGQIIHHWARDDDTRQHVIELNPAIARLYSKDGWSSIEWKQRLGLKGQPLAQWLHGFYSTHAQPYHYKVETLLKLCGSENRELKGFRRELKKALEKVASQTGWSWSIDETDLVHIDKTPTRSQNRHLTRRKTDKKPRGTA